MKPRTKLIFLTTCFVLLSCHQGTMSEVDKTEKLEAELKLDDLELVDICENIANARKTVYLVQNYEEKVKEEEAYGQMIKAHYEVLNLLEDIPVELERNYTYQVKPGDGLLPEDKWNKLVVYKNRIEKIANRMKLNDSDLSLIAKSDYHNILRTTRAANDLQSTWSAWQDIYSVSDIESFPNHLQLVKEAAALNGLDSVQEYWQSLSDFQGAYTQADDFWKEISPFYKRLLGFVSTRLSKFYNISQEVNEIPVYLLGIPVGTDWSNIADIVLPHPQLHYDVESYLKYRTVKDIYKYSENVVKSMGLGTLGDKFWQNSSFDASTCGPETFEFCDSEYTEISECNKPSWKVYLDAHETSLKIALNNMDYLGLTRQNLRFSGVDYAIETLGSLIAINSLPYHGLINENIFKGDDNSANMTRLLLTALRVMPRLSYYLMADKWRLEEIELNDTSVVEKYWKYRKDVNGVKGDTNKEPEYLEDSHILANKPYISKFFGTLIAFQLFEYYQERSENLTNLVEDFGQDETFIAMVRERHTIDWSFLLTQHYGLDVSAAELIKYFEPLDHYFETAPAEQVPIVTTTTTTTTTTTSTTPKPTTSPRLVASKAANNLDTVVLNDEPKLNTSSAEINGHSGPIRDSHVAMWIGVGLAVIVACALIAGYGYKTLRKKRRTNNRRFDT